jgi:hypothetical protein
VYTLSARVVCNLQYDPSPREPARIITRRPHKCNTPAAALDNNAGVNAPQYLQQLDGACPTFFTRPSPRAQDAADGSMGRNDGARDNGLRIDKPLSDTSSINLYLAIEGMERVVPLILTRLAMCRAGMPRDEREPIARQSLPDRIAAEHRSQYRAGRAR